MPSSAQTMEGFFMSKKFDAKRLRQIQKLTLETARLQRPAISPQEQRVLAEKLVNATLGRAILASL